MITIDNTGSMRLATVSFVFVFVIAAVTFGYTWQGQMAYMQRDSITATPTEYSLTSAEEDGSIAVTVRVENPTSKAIQVRYGNVMGDLGDDQVVRSSSPDALPLRVPAGGEQTFTVDCKFVGGTPSEETVARIRAGDMRVAGQLDVYIVDKKISVGVVSDD